jgi:hypothetical protein
LKFRKELPKEQGYYWFFHVEWPVPVIGFLAPFQRIFSCVSNKFDRGTEKA